MRPYHFVLPALSLLACSASSAPDDAVASQSEITIVDPAKCPRELRVQLGFGFAEDDIEGIAARLPPRDAERFQAAVDEYSAMVDAPVQIEAADPVITADSCTYSQAPGTTAVLRNGPDGAVLEITTGHLHIVAHPKRFAREGIRFGAETATEVSAILSDGKLVEFADVAIDATGEQIARYAAFPAVRIPVLQSTLAPIREVHLSFPETMVIDADHGTKKYEGLELVLGPESGSDLAGSGAHILMGASPAALRTTDPDTTICFLGPPEGICGIMGLLSGSVIGKEFTFADAGRGEGCQATDLEVTMTFHGGDAPELQTLTIPRCQ